MSSADVLIITPTRGGRSSWFARMVTSLRNQRASVRHVVVVPEGVDASRFAGSEVVVDRGTGLSAAFNDGLAAADGEPFLLWLNDDDWLEPGGLDALVGLLRRRPDAPAAVGAVGIAGTEGSPVTTLRGGRLTVGLLPWGPGMMASPAVLYRTDAVTAVGGLDERLLHAGDLDLLLRLSKMARIAATRQVVGWFRWHDDSLTVRDPMASLREAEAVRAAFHADAGRARGLAYRAWRPLARLATRAAKTLVTSRSRRPGGGSEIRE